MELEKSVSYFRDIFGETVQIREARLDDLDLSLGDLKSLDRCCTAGV